MTRTFNPESYGKLLAKYKPKTITSKEENEQAIKLAQSLEYRPNRTPEEDILLELLVTLIEKFAEINYPIPQGKLNSKGHFSTCLYHILHECWLITINCQPSTVN